MFMRYLRIRLSTWAKLSWASSNELTGRGRNVLRVAVARAGIVLGSETLTFLDLRGVPTLRFVGTLGPRRHPVKPRGGPAPAGRSPASGSRRGAPPGRSARSGRARTRRG